MAASAHGLAVDGTVWLKMAKPFACFFATVEQLIQPYDDEGIEKGCVLPIVSPEIYLPQANEDILDMAAQYPDRIIPWCNIDPRALTNAADFVRAFYGLDQTDYEPGEDLKTSAVPNALVLLNPVTDMTTVPQMSAQYSAFSM